MNWDRNIIQFETMAGHGRWSPLRLLIAGLGLQVLFLGLPVGKMASAQSSTVAEVGAAPPSAEISISARSSKPPFLVRSYESTANLSPLSAGLPGKCLDYGIPAGVPAGSAASVFLNECNQAHPIVVQELNDGKHDVILHAGSKIIGIRRAVVVASSATSSAALTSPTEYALGLYSPRTIAAGIVNDVFALDGDSIILASSRCASTIAPACVTPPTQLVVQLQRGLSDIGTPLVLAPRDLADTEFWDFIATDNSGADPTSGFYTVSDRNTLLIAMYEVNQIATQNYGAAWGSVIRILDTGEPIDLTPNPASVDAGGNSVNSIHNLVVPTGVTIRGDRRGTNPGPLLIGRYNDPSADPGDRLMQIEGDYVRITGLRLQGPSGNEDTWADTTGILLGDPFANAHQPIETIIDHNEVFDWPTDAIQPFAGSETEDCANGQPGNINAETGGFVAGPIGSLDAAFIERNFIHHTAEQGLGYGVVVSEGAGATILGNTFLYNRHAIAADGSTGNRYSAWDNLVLSDAPQYCGFLNIFCKAEQDFDMHGTQSSGGQHDGGWAGFNVDIGWNSFLGQDHPIFTLRGRPCHEPDLFHNNVSREDSGDAFEEWDYSGNESKPTSSTSELTIQNNSFDAADPTTQLGVGDFDGDGRQDLFLATGTTWFYSPGGVTEWRYLNGGKTDKLQSLLLGDFDGDGRTDVVGINGSHLMISWGGVSDWEVLNTVPAGASIKDMAAGDFDGDGHADLFYADGANWYVSYGGSTPFQFVNTSSWRVNNLRFGHFSICGRRGETDLFGIVTGKWQVTCGARQDWVPLPVTLTTNLTNLFVADFDGDGNADIAVASSTPQYIGNRMIRWPWQFSHDGAQHFVTNLVSPTYSCPDLGNNLTNGLLLAGIGRFSGNPTTDILLWGGNRLCIIPAGIDEAQAQSRQLMR